MGLETILIASTVASVAGQAYSSVKSREYQKDAQEDEKEAQKIQTAAQQNKDRVSRRKAAKEARIRRARLVNSAETSGATGSSAVGGALSALGSNYGQAVAAQTSSTNAAIAASDKLQDSADSLGKARDVETFGKLFSNTIKSGTQLGVDLDIF